MYGSIDGPTDVWTDKIPLCILNDIALLVQCPKMFDKDILKIIKINEKCF